MAVAVMYWMTIYGYGMEESSGAMGHQDGWVGATIQDQTFIKKHAQSVGGATAKVHAVGSGNCVTVVAQAANDGQREAMIIDCGSTGNTTRPEDISKLMLEEVGKHTVARIDPVREEKRDILGIMDTVTVEGGDPTVQHTPHFKTILITHPDKDHYNIIEQLLVNERITCDNIVLSGDVSLYSDTFLGAVWKYMQTPRLADSSHRKPTLFLLAHSLAPIAIEKVTREEIGGKLEMVKQAIVSKWGNVYAPQLWYDPKNDLHIVQEANHQVSLELQKALSFDKGTPVKFQVLTANPTHVSSANGTVLPLSDDAYILPIGQHEVSDDQNLRSLTQGQPMQQKDTQAEPPEKNETSTVVKIEAEGGPSMILTGDMTRTTEKRIFLNYMSDPEILKGRVVLSSHHGSSANGANSATWASLTRPAYLITSSGLNPTQGGPTKVVVSNYEETLCQGAPTPGNTAAILWRTSFKDRSGRRLNSWNVSPSTPAFFHTAANGSVTVYMGPKEKDVVIAQQHSTILQGGSSIFSRTQPRHFDVLPLLGDLPWIGSRALLSSKKAEEGNLKKRANNLAGVNIVGGQPRRQVGLSKTIRKEKGDKEKGDKEK